jgi:hypothetical protein
VDDEGSVDTSVTDQSLIWTPTSYSALEVEQREVSIKHSMLVLDDHRWTVFQEEVQETDRVHPNLLEDMRKGGGDVEQDLIDVW